MLELFISKFSKTTFIFRFFILINNKFWPLKQIFKSFSFFIAVDFDLNYLKLLALVGIPSFSHFDISFVNNINFKKLDSFLIF